MASRIPLSGSVKDPTIQKAINQVERDVSDLLDRRVYVEGDTAGNVALQNLLQALADKGLIVDLTT